MILTYLEVNIIVKILDNIKVIVKKVLMIEKLLNFKNNSLIYYCIKSNKIYISFKLRNRVWLLKFRKVLLNVSSLSYKIFEIAKNYNINLAEN